MLLETYHCSLFSATLLQGFCKSFTLDFSTDSRKLSSFDKNIVPKRFIANVTVIVPVRIIKDICTSVVTIRNA